MSLKVLALAVEPTNAAACLAAASVAAAVDAQAVIEVLHVRADPDRMIAADEEIAIQRLREHDEGSAADRARAVRATFDAWHDGLAAQGQRARWREVTGTVEETIAQESAGADLIVLAKPHDLDGRDALHAALFDSRCLILLTPPDRPVSTVGRRIAVGWSGSEQVRNALDGAMPWLRAAEEVTLIAIGEEHASAENAAAALKQEGVAAKAFRLPDDGSSVADQLLNAVRSRGTDTLLTGAYRHNAFLEWLLGGASAELIEQAAIPVFMRH